MDNEARSQAASKQTLTGAATNNCRVKAADRSRAIEGLLALAVDAPLIVELPNYYYACVLPVKWRSIHVVNIGMTLAVPFAAVVPAFEISGEHAH